MTALPNWGALEKSTDDSSTIDDAIAAAIAAHDAASDSHLADGASLASHKSTDVIDHPAASIVPDKTSVSDPGFSTTFENLDGFTVVGDVVNTSWPGATLSTPPPSGDVSSVLANLVGMIDTGSHDYDILFDVAFYTDPNDSTYIVNIGLMNTGLSTFALGFRITGGDIYGLAHWSSAEHLTAALYTPGAGEFIQMRVYFDQTANIIHYYVNGEDVAQLTPGANLDLQNQFGFKNDDNGGDGTVLRIFNFYITRSL